MKRNILRFFMVAIFCCCAAAVLNSEDTFAKTYHVGDSVSISSVTEYGWCTKKVQNWSCSSTEFDIGFYADGEWKNPYCTCQNPGYDLTTKDDFKYFFVSASGTVTSVSNGSAAVYVYINMGKTSLGYGLNAQDMACTVYLDSDPEDYYDDGSDSYSYDGVEYQYSEEFEIEGSSNVTGVTNVEGPTSGVYEMNSATRSAEVSFEHEMWQNPNSIFNVSVNYWGPSSSSTTIRSGSVKSVTGSKTGNPALAKNDSPTSVCQKINFRSKTWSYDIVRDTRTTVTTQYSYHYDSNGNLLDSTETGSSSKTVYTSSPYIDTSSITGYGDAGSSEEACVQLHRQWNFRVDSIDNLRTDEIAYTGETLTQAFSIDIVKNNSTYPITDIPDATISLCHGVRGSESCEDLYSNVTIRGASGEINNSSTYTSYDKDNYTISGIEKTITIPDVKAGTEYCVWLKMTPSNSGNGYYSRISKVATKSATTCYTVAKKPLFHVYGNNVYVSGNVAARISNKKINGGAAHLYGSWAELGLAVNGTNNTLASGAALALGGDSAALCANYNPLTITNNGNCGNKSGVIRDGGRRVGLIEQYRNADNTFYSDQTISVYPSGSGVKLVAVDGANITISGNLVNGSRSSSIATADGMSTLILYAENIYIDCNVGRIDAVLVAEKKIDTCYNPGDSESDSAKNARNRSNQLIINGAIVANTLQLGRTYGAATGNNSDVPAEIINMETGIYLLGRQEESSNGALDSTYLRELAPRY